MSITYSQRCIIEGTAVEIAVLSAARWHHHQNSSARCEHVQPGGGVQIQGKDAHICESASGIRRFFIANGTVSPLQKGRVSPSCTFEQRHSQHICNLLFF
jgi:hypothetical protein